MRAWPAPDVPAVPRPATVPVVRVTDTSTGERVATTGPDVPTDLPLRLYVCGITPYDATHLGHASTYVAFDLLHRAWLDAGYPVHYVQNVTDVDDPLLERAARDGERWQDLAAREIARFREDVTALAVLPPRDYVGAVETVDEVAAAAVRLLETGSAYDVDGDVYFSVHADPSFGTVSGLPEPQMLALFAERGGDPDRPGKKHPLDCLLWQAERPGEPAWDSPLGRGRPGWHLECAVIAGTRLGTPFDVQGGGSDLAFPHHEMSAAESGVLTGSRPFARAYVHAGMVGHGGEKMSKSKGNLVFVSALRADGVDPMTVRLALLGHHYRTDWEWTPDDLAGAQRRLDRWRDAMARPAGPAGEPLLDALRERLADDLDAPGALAAVDAWADRQDGEGGADPAGPGVAARAVNALLGVRL